MSDCRLWKARFRLCLRFWLVDTFGWIGRWLPMALLSYAMWFSLTGVRFLIAVPDPNPPHLMSDPAGPGFVDQSK